MYKLVNYGFNQGFLKEVEAYPELEVGRVTSQTKDLYKVVTNDGELLAEVSGKFRFASQRIADYPAVGDFVLLDRGSGQGGHGIIHHLLTRKSAFKRSGVGVANQSQIVAANIDWVFICMALNKDYNLRRLERYLALAWDSGATPVVILTKGDLCEALETRLKEVEAVALGADVLVTSSLDEESAKQLLKYLQPGQTASFIGSSGVGKSTLINHLIGEDLLAIGELRNDDKGRHTSTRRELILLPSGGVVIDTPGMRELGVDSGDFAKSFADIDELATGCKFKDCAHQKEPQCALRAAVAEGRLTLARLESYLKLKREAGYEGLNAKQIESKKLETMFAEVGGMKNAKKFAKGKNKQK